MFLLQKKLFFGTERILILHFHKTICVLQLPMVLTPFLTFQLSSGMHCRTFFVPVFLQTLRPKYRMLPSCRFFLPDILKLKIVNCK